MNCYLENLNESELKDVKHMKAIVFLVSRRFLGNNQIHPLQRVKAEWKGDFRFGLEGSFSRSFKSLLFWILSRLFSSIFLNSGHTKMNTEGRTRLDDVWVSKICQFFPDF